MPYFLCLHITLRLFVKVFGARNSLVYKISNPPWESVEPFDKGRINAFRRNINNLIAIAKHNDIKPIIVKWVCDWDSEIVPAYFSKSNSADLSNKFKNYLLANNQVLEELASQNGVPYFDPGEFNSDCFSDKMHFNKKGLLLMSKRASNFMLRTII